MTESITPIQYAWIIYGCGALGCAIAAWWMFLWAWRFVRYSVVVTVLVLLATPFAIDQQTMTMAPAIYTLVFDGLGGGVEAIKPLIKLMTGIWLILVVLILVFVILTRGRSYDEQDDHHNGRYGSKSHKQIPKAKSRKKTKAVERPYERHLSREEKLARDELLDGEVPMRAVRD